jgi:uncharacterized membrane protein
MSDSRSGNSRKTGNKQSRGSGNGRRMQMQSAQRYSYPEAYRSEPCQSKESTQNVGDGERLISLAAGGVLGLAGLARGGIRGLALATIGAGLAYRGYTGHCHTYAALGLNTAKRNRATGVPAQQGCKIEKTIVVDSTPEELYKFWRRFENLPKVMRHLKSVDSGHKQLSHWVAEGAFGKDVEWDAEVINERENELIAWRSLPGGDVDTAGSVHFEPLGAGRGTQVTVTMKYNPPAGKVGATLAAVLGEGLEDKLEEDLNSFKQVMETGMPAAPPTK